MNHHLRNRRVRRAVAAALAVVAAPASAQAPQAPARPPQAQAWIDVATFGGFGMPGGAGATPANPMAALGGLFGGGAAGRPGGNSFGQTQGMAAGRWVDVTVMTRQNPGLAEAQQAVPAGFLSPALRLQSPPPGAARPAPDDDERVVEHEAERPSGRLLMYWGCGDTVRAGQPKVLDMARATPDELARFFVGRRATQRGAHSAPGRPLWPNPVDARMVPAGASLAGEHAFSGAGIPEGMRFRIDAARDLMPPLALKQQDAGGATLLTWPALPHARAYFVAAMGARGDKEMVIWTSSEVPDTGMGLIDYQTNAAVDRWLGEKVLLPPSRTDCSVPKGIFAAEGGAMLRAIAYGSELNLVHPPRPTDPRTPWEPVWAVKLRVKSVGQAMLGMPEMPAAEAPAESAPRAEPAAEAPKPKALDLLRGILGR